MNVYVLVTEFKMFTHTQMKNRKKTAIHSQPPQAIYKLKFNKKNSLCSVWVQERVQNEFPLYELHSQNLSPSLQR